MLTIILAGCATSPTVRKTEALTASYAADLDTNLTALARHQDNIMSYLNNSLSFFGQQVQTNQVDLTVGALEASHQEQVAKVITLLFSESESQAREYFALAADSAATTNSYSSGLKAILDSLDSESKQLTNLGKGVSTSGELQFILNYSKAVTSDITQAQHDAVKNAQQGVAESSSTTTNPKPTTP